MGMRKGVAAMAAAAVLTTISLVPSASVAWADEDAPVDTATSTSDTESFEVVDSGVGIFGVVPFQWESTDRGGDAESELAAARWQEPYLEAAVPTGLPQPPFSDLLDAPPIATFKLTSPNTSQPITTGTPTFAGTGATPGTKVYVLSHDEDLSYCNGGVAANGSWSCTPTYALPNGLQRLRIQGYGSFDERLELVVRIADPNPILAVQSPTQDQRVTSSKPVFSGVGRDGYSVNVVNASDSKDVYCKATVKNGQWSCQSSHTYPEGAATALVVAWASSTTTSWAQVSFVVDASAAKATYAHTFHVVVASKPGQPTTWITQATVQSYLSDLGATYSAWTGETWTASVSAANFKTLSTSNICSDAQTQRDQELNAAASLFGHETKWYLESNGVHLLVLENAKRDCPASYGAQGYGSAPSTQNPISGGAITIRFDESTASMKAYMPHTIMHEFGHNLGWAHSNVQVCTPGATKPGAWDQGRNSTNCTKEEYADAWDLMGSTVGSTLTSFELMANRGYADHVLPRGGALTVAEAGASKTSVTIVATPVLGGSGVQSLVVRDMYPSANDPFAGWDFVFELRKPVAGLSATGVAVTRTDGRESVLLQDATTAVSDRLTPGKGHYLGLGETFTSYSGGVVVTVKSINNTQAVLEVTRSAPNVAIAKPTIQGAVVLGSTVSARVASRTPADAQLSYQWYLDGKAISGATSSTYKPVAGDIGHQLSVRVSAWAAGYTAVASTSVATKVFKEEGVSLYRFYNWDSATHFYTAEESEKNAVIDNWDYNAGKGPFSLDGAVGRVVPSKVASDADQVVVHRFYLPAIGVHFYSSDPVEVEFVKNAWPDVFTYEGPAYVAYARTGDASGCAVPGTIAYYRFYNNDAGVHFYTADEAERDRVIDQWDYASGKGPFSLDGIAYCILPK